MSWGTRQLRLQRCQTLTLVILSTAVWFVILPAPSDGSLRRRPQTGALRQAPSNRPMDSATLSHAERGYYGANAINRPKQYSLACVEKKRKQRMAILYKRTQSMLSPFLYHEGESNNQVQDRAVAATPSQADNVSRTWPRDKFILVLNALETNSEKQLSGVAEPRRTNAAARDNGRAQD